MTARLNVNIDHVATVRQARRAPEPSVIAAAMACEQAGADGITVHLRGDRRHIQDLDIKLLRPSVTTYLNVEMAATEEMLAIALKAKPHAACIVPEKREERTTEGGIDSAGRRAPDQDRNCQADVGLRAQRSRTKRCAHHGGGCGGLPPEDSGKG